MGVDMQGPEEKLGKGNGSYEDRSLAEEIPVEEITTHKDAEAKYLMGLKHIGEILRQSREEKGYTIEEMAGFLCLRKTVIMAIESGDWSGLPHEVYARGYIRKYASLLDKGEAIAPFLKGRQHINSNGIERPIETSEKHKRMEHKGGKTWLFDTLLSKRMIVSLSCAILVFAFFLIHHFRTERLIDVRLESAMHLSKEAIDLKHDTSVPEIAETKRLLITCHDRTWVGVIIDGREKKEFMLNSDEMLVLNAKDKFELLIGNAGGIKLVLNGRPVDFSGELGEVKRLTLR
jgi:transcriptional regulator with XRE-family HTH domain